ncbi:UPF0182 family protein [Gemmatimonas sp.]|uniref:UPF0182 family protein n=1 Tax=Gemmatimonas sp. TaxID=1962908 RepID=UPI003983A9F4
MGARGGLILGLAFAAALLLLGRAVTALFVDHAWFTAMGQPALFWEQVIDAAILQGGAWGLGALFAFANLHAVRRTIVAVAVPSRVANLELVAMISGQRLMAVTVVLALAVGGVLALPLTNWVDLALLRHGLPFEEIEGVLGRDLGFYLYWLPVEETLYLWSLVSVVSMTALVVVLYALTRSLRMEGRRVAASTHVRRHLSVLGAIVLLLLAWSYRLDAFDLLRQGSGPDGLFLKVDHRVTLRMDSLLSFGSALAALVVFRTGWVGQLRAAFLALTIVLVAALGLRHVAPAVLARTSLLGEPATRDLDYLASRALYSRRAFDVEGMRVVHRDSGAAALTRMERTALPSRLSLWDRGTMGDALAATRTPESEPRDKTPAGQSLRDVAPIGWTVVGDRITALVVRRAVGGAQGWQVSALDATRPTLRDSQVEFAPISDDYAGDEPLVGPGLHGVRLIDAEHARGVRGVSLTSLRARIAHAWALRDLSLLEADTTAVEPLLVTHRDVRERVERLAPIFVQGNEVLPLVHDGRLYWTLQLYSASDRYPLSQHWQLATGVYSYFRLAATAVVEASTGQVRLVAAPRPDAPTRTWMTRLPTLFAAPGELPPLLVSQLPPANESAVAQIKSFARYGSRLEGSVVRQLPDSALVGGAPPPHWIGIDRERLVAWSVPLLDDGDQIGGIVTVGGGLARQTWWDSTTIPRQRWRIMTARMQAALDSARGTMPDGSRREPRSRAGRVTTLMSTTGPLLVQPLFSNRAEGAAAVARVVASDGVRLGVGATLVEALGRMGDIPMPAVPVAGLDEEGPSSGAARRWYAAMREALRRGDWAKLGAAFDSLGRVLERPPQ